MADGKKKRPGRKAYLDDFQRTASGAYVYNGELHYFVEQGMTRVRALTVLWALTAGMAAAAVTAGCVPAAGTRDTVYVLLPYAGSLLSVASVVGAMCRLTTGGDPLRDYVYRATVGQFRARGVLVLLFAGGTLLGGAVNLRLHRAGELLSGTVIFLICEALVFIFAFLWKSVFLRLKWSK